MNAEEIIRAAALPSDPGSLASMVKDLAREIAALRAEVASLRKAILQMPHPDHR